MKTLPAKYYLDPDVFAKERHKIFKSAWWLLCPEHMVQKHRSYFSDCIAGWPVFALRGDDGSLRAFKNVCRHRGAVLLERGSGETKRILCPYHGWTYADDGRLLAAPKFGDSNLPVDDLGLHEIDVHLWNGLVFVKIGRGEGDEFNQWIGEVDRLCQDFPGPSDLNYHDDFTISGEINWKLYCENTVEGYHLNSVHARLGKSLAGGSVNLYSVNDGYAVVFDVIYKSLADKEKLRAGRGLWVYCFPGFQMVLGERLFKAERVDPSSVGGIRSHNWSWFGDMSESEVSSSFDWGKTIVNEDLGICSSVYRNMKAGTFEPGPLSPDMEVLVIEFQERIRRIVDSDK